MIGELASRAGLTYRTVRHLQPLQLVHRIRLRTQKVVLTHFPVSATRLVRGHATPMVQWPANFVPLDGRLSTEGAEAMAAGGFTFLGETRSLGHPPDWSPSCDQLWRYHLHYFEWGWAFASHPDRAWASQAFRDLWRSWRDASPFGRWDAWSPYVASVRAWSFCGLYWPLVDGTDDADEFARDLVLHARFLRAHLELDAGGNHLVKNLKALVGLGVALDWPNLVDVGLGHLERQLSVQVLADGGHFERSPSYHCQVLGDLIDMRDLVVATGRDLDWLDDAIARMQGWLGAILLPDGDVPLFNDSVLVGEARLKLLEPDGSPAARVTVLDPSGYVVARPSARVHLVADVGPPCPPELPAHAHADCLSFELCIDGERVVVDTGTSTYAPGERRDFERSTAAHNTLEIDGHDQTEVWGVFRAGRLAEATLEHVADEGDAVVVVASHDGYTNLPGAPTHRREWHIAPESIRIIDSVSGSGRHHIRRRLHLAAPTAVTVRGDGTETVTRAIAATGFGETHGVTCMTWADDAVLPARFETVLDVVTAWGDG